MTSSITARSSGGPGEIPGQQLAGLAGQDWQNQQFCYN